MYLWEELPDTYVAVLKTEQPRLAAFVDHLEQKIAHEQRTMRVSVWEEEYDHVALLPPAPCRRAVRLLCTRLSEVPVSPAVN